MVVDDTAAFRSVLRRILARESDITVVGEADNGTDAVTMALEKLPDVVVMDVSMPELDGIAATAALAAAVPDVRVVLLSIGNKPTEVAAGLESGAAEYLVKGASASDIVATIRRHGRPAD